MRSELCLSSGQEQPPSHRQCNLGPCPFWRTSDWSAVGTPRLLSLEMVIDGAQRLPRVSVFRHVWIRCEASNCRVRLSGTGGRSVILWRSKSPHNPAVLQVSSNLRLCTFANIQRPSLQSGTMHDVGGVFMGSVLCDMRQWNSDSPRSLCFGPEKGGSQRFLVR